MTKKELFGISINSIDSKIFESTKNRWDSIAKPIDGFGEFEEIICRISAIIGCSDPDITNRALLVFCSDNGIVSRGVTQSEQDITRLVALALGQGKSSANCIAEKVNVKVIPVDIGINSAEKLDGVLDYKVAPGTKDFLTEPAMTEEETLKAIDTGISLVEKLAKDMVKLIATGEMGIGNTTTSAAVLSTILGCDSDTIVGRGAGLSDERLDCKRKIVKEGIEKYLQVFGDAADEKERCFEILRCLGGLDIAAMCGVFIGGAIYGIPVIIDGVISATAALLAEKMIPGVKEFMIASHSGKEAGTGLALEKLGKHPVISGDMALGEGTGALMMISLIDNALFFYKKGSGFVDNGIEEYERFR